MTNVKWRSVFIYCFFSFLILTNFIVASEVDEENIFQKEPAVITKIIGIYDGEETDEISSGKVQRIVVKITKGAKKGKEYEATHNLMTNTGTVFAFDELKVGDKVYVTIDERTDTPEVFVSGIQRQLSLLLLVILFLALVLIIGKMKGLKTIISILVTIILVFGYAFPQIIKGTSPILVSIIICAISTVTTFTLISGFNKKTVAAIIGNLGGVVLTGIIAMIFGRFGRLSGVNEETMFLAFLPQGTNLDLIEILLAGIIIGALGACMDVAMSIASALEELKKENPKITKNALFKSGLNIGKDVMGTMTNTLILAYVGSSIGVLILYMAYNMSTVEIINVEALTEAIIRSISGSIGIIGVIPLTAFISSILYSKSNQDEE
ncbi:MAG: YibE/F family protein [Clostridia bacterium]|nr:YibE/F family protein [Clostridia bacterium]MDD4376236.1 YibE/F family protein [Clostridia bacterium]